MDRCARWMISTPAGTGAAVAVCFALVEACSAQNDAVRPPNELELVDAPPTHDAGCTRVQTRADDGGCRIDWSCTDGGLHTFACQPDDGGELCVCLRGSTPAEPRPVADAACAPSAAAKTCGWAVEP